MKALFFRGEDRPVHVGEALRFAAPNWLVTCTLSRQAPFGKLSTEIRYQVEGGTEAEAQNAVRSQVLEAHPGFAIESMRIDAQAPR